MGPAGERSCHPARKICHMAVGSGILLATLYTPWLGLSIQWWMLAISGLGLFLEYCRLKNQKFNQLVFRIVAPFARASEQESISGITYFFIGAAFTLLFFPTKITLLAIAYLSYADPLASAFGIKFGTVKGPRGKSLTGLCTMIICCLLITLGFLYQYASPAGIHWAVFLTVGPLSGAMAEYFSGRINDNLAIPLATGAILTFVNFFTGTIPI